MESKNIIFEQLLTHIPRKKFEEFVTHHEGDKYIKTFRCWDHFITMLYCQLTNKNSLRDLEAGFNSQFNYHERLKTKAVYRSTLSDANHIRSVELYKDLFSYLASNIIQKQERKKAEEILRIIDSSPIMLKGYGFEWAENNHRITGFKLHTIYDPKMNMPIDFSITSPRVNDIVEGKKQEIKKGIIYIFDKGYYDFRWWWSIHEAKAYFVSRPKKDMKYKILRKKEVEDKNILSDQIIKVTTQAGKKFKANLRLLRIKLDNGKQIKIISNKLNTSAKKIAALYKIRWDIELFFKWVKQNLRIKKFLGKTANAVKLQVIVALISYLLLYLCKQVIKSIISMKGLLVVIRDNLFQRITIEAITKPPPYKLNACVKGHINPLNLRRG